MTGKKFPNKPKDTCIRVFILCAICFFAFSSLSYAINFEFPERKSQDEEGIKEDKSIIINADTVEYATDNKSVTATGNVEIDYGGTKLTCQKLTMDTQTKEGTAEGNARLDDQQGVIEGEKLIYNFATKTGTIIDAQFRANPYFGKAKKIEKRGDVEFVAYNAYATTCNLDKPHFRILTEQMNMFPKDKIQTKGDTIFVGDVPVMYMPRFNRSLKDKMTHLRVVPGKSKDWGYYVLGSWKYNLTESVDARLFLDYRQKTGWGEGLGMYYRSMNFGKGDFKYYYLRERDTKPPLGEGTPQNFRRWFIRLRHKWDIDKDTNLTGQYYWITDTKRQILGTNYNVLKDFFLREYEKDSQPPTYVSIHRAFPYSSLDVYIQKRVNRWYDSGYLERLPELLYTMPSLQFGNTSLYYESTSTAGNYNKKNTSSATPLTNPLTPDTHVNRIDTTNKFSYPMKVAFIQMTPNVTSRQTFYDKDVNANAVIRTVFSSGADLSTKFYRIFNIKTNFLGLNIKDLRHIITPTVAYSYGHTPTIASAKLRQIDAVDTVTQNHVANITLNNKLQTKRNGQNVDVVDLNVTTAYQIKPKTGDKRGSNLSDFYFELKVLPYSWLSIAGDATYKHSGNRSDPNYNSFSNVNWNMNFDFGGQRTFSINQRYQKKGGNQLTLDLDWRLNPKWKVSAYHRYERGHDAALNRGLREQEYTVTRDLHCWETSLNYNVKRGYGDSIWIVFTCKAFPELGFDIQQKYNEPQPGSQSNP